MEKERGTTGIIAVPTEEGVSVSIRIDIRGMDPEKVMSAQVSAADLAGQAGIPIPVVVPEKGFCNMFFGIVHEQPLIFAGSEILESLTEQETRAMLAHEISHERDSYRRGRRSIAGVLVRSVLAIHEFAYDAVSKPGSIAYAISGALGLDAAFCALGCAMQRRDERRADRYAARAAGAENLASAFMKTSEMNPLEPAAQPGSGAGTVSWDAEAEGGHSMLLREGESVFDMLYSEHPTSAKRLAMLARMARKEKKPA